MTTQPSRRLWRQGSITDILAAGTGVVTVALAVFVLREQGQFFRMPGITAALFALLILPVLSACLFQYGRRVEQERQLSHLAANIPGFVYTIRLSPDGHVRTSFASAGILDIGGVQAVALLHPDDHARVKAAATASARALTPLHAEFRVLHPEKGELWVEVRSLPQVEPDGRIGWHGIALDITERKRLQDVLTTRERNFRTLVENSPDPIFRYDRDCRRLYVNPAVGRLLGKPPEELIGRIPADGTILVPAQIRYLMQAIRQVFDSGETKHIDLDHVAQDGGHRDYDMLLVPECDTHGQVTTVLALARDITPIRDAERLQSRFLSNLPGFVYSFRMSPEAHFSFPFASPGIEDFYGLRPEDVRHDMAPLHALAHPEDRPRIESAIAESARAMTPLQVEFRVRRPDQPERWLEVISTPEREIDGGILWHGIMLDITKRKHLEAELARSETEFRTLVENSPDAIIRYDRECRRIYCNPAHARLSGAPSAELLGKTIAEISQFPPDVAKAYASLIRQVIDNAQAGEMELNWQTNGAPAAIHVRVNPEFDGTGRVVSALAVGRDVSAIKQAEGRLRKSHDILRALAAHRETEHEKERRDIAHQIHEDLAQNLSALRLNISLFEMSGESASRAPLLKVMHDIADHTIVRIRDMVSMLRPTVLDLGLVPALQWLTDDFKGAGLQFELALQEDVLLHDEVSTFLFRAAQEALVNVALHATATHVHLSLNTVAGVCCLVVRDNGHGFDPDAACSENAFGLIGLREQALHLGGDLSIASTLDQGTTLEIRVPCFTGETAL